MPSFVANPTEIQGFTPGSVATNQTVQGQVSGLMDSDNPLLKKAKTKAAQAANQRGLLNSSMGVQAGQEALLSAALPIAQFDATQYSNQAQLNQDWQNKFGLEGNAYQYQTGLSEQDYQQQTGTGSYGTGLIGAQTAAQSQLQSERAAQDLAAQAQSEAHQSGLQSSEQTFAGEQAELERGQQTAMQSAEFGQQTAMQSAEIDAQREALASEIKSREDLAGNQITHEEALAEADRILKTQLQTQAETFGESQASLDRGQQTALQEAEFEQQSEMQASEQAQQTALQASEQAQQTAMQTAEFAQQSAIQAQEQRNVLARMLEEFSQKGKLSEQEHNQLKDAVAAEYGLKGTHQELVDKAANFRAEIAAESARFAAEAGLTKEALRGQQEIEEKYMEDWVEINKMVFDPEDVGNDSKLRQEAIDALKVNYDERRKVVAGLTGVAKDWDWGTPKPGAGTVRSGESEITGRPYIR